MQESAPAQLRRRAELSCFVGHLKKKGYFDKLGIVVTKDNAKAYTEYFFRFETELRMLWARQFQSRIAVVMGVNEFRKTLVEDHWIFG